MSIFRKLFGGGREVPAPEPPAAAMPPAPRSAATPPPPDPEARPEEPDAFIRVFDEYGREVAVAREEWRTNVLPANLRSRWDDPDALYGVILHSLDDGFHAEVLDAAAHLREIDPIPARGACIHAIVLSKLGRLDEAERVLDEQVARHGEDGVVLTNLAKLHAERGDQPRAEATLWRALEVDPNQDNGLAWYEAIHRERDGEAAALDALRRVAALAGSWRAGLWLARAALRVGEVERALEMYREGLSRLDEPAPADALAQVSADLGNAGRLAEAIELVEPRFVPEAHGLQVGNNLLKAHLDSGQVQPARRILEQLWALRRPDWRDTLQFWDEQVARAELPDGVPPGQPLSVTLVTVDGPVWLTPDSPAARLFAATGQDAGPRITFLGSTADKGTSSDEVEVQLTDSAGRLSRALPLFLAEQVAMSTRAPAATLVPWILADPGGFVLGGDPWDDAQAAEWARRGELPADFVVVTHLDARGDPWTAELRLLRASDGARLGELRALFPLAGPGPALRALADELLALLRDRAEVAPAEPPALYQLPDLPWLPAYLLRLEQLLAIRGQRVEGAPGRLHGEREIFDGMLQLCLEFPGSVPARLVLAQALLTMHGLRPELAAEFTGKVARLQEEHPLPGPAGGVVAEMLSPVLSPA